MQKDRNRWPENERSCWRRKRITQLFPNGTISCFSGYNHAQMCLAKPDVYVANVKKLIAGCEN